MTTGQTLLALLAAIIVPGLIVHFTLGRQGGHHLFGNLPPEEAKRLPQKYLDDQLRRQGRGATSTLLALVVALTVYPLACRLGLPLNAWGLSPTQLFWWTAGGVVVLVALLRRRWREHSD